MTTLTIGLVGNPNCGKSTVFNCLTGANQKVGNWPGVTVECKKGNFSSDEKQVTVIDLPGVYQLSYPEPNQAIDEKITCDYIFTNQSDVIVNIIDAAHLERHLYLTLQLLTMKAPLIIAINMLDVANRRHIELDLAKLQSILGCPVIGLTASKKLGIHDLKKAISHYEKSFQFNKLIHYPANLEEAIHLLAMTIQQYHPELAFCTEWLAQQLLQNSTVTVNPEVNKVALEIKTNLEQQLNEELDIVFADILYTTAHTITQQVQTQQPQKASFTERLDKIVLNRFLGIPIFLMVMYAMFLFAINFGGAFQDFFDISSEAIFVQGTTQLLTYFHSPNWLVAVIAAGFGRGVNTMISFVPVIGAMFLFLAFLEGSGYMARASFVIDRFMRFVGLPGKSFVPLIIGFGCNVPAILASRTLENPRDRILTILMSPFMSCGARLAIFAVFTAAFFPAGGQNVVFLLYLIGIIAAVLTGFILRKTFLQGELTPVILELPVYHMPLLSPLLHQTWQRLKSFIFRAGKLIIPVCMLIGVLNAVNKDGTLNKVTSSQSILASVGRVVTPVFAPMGINNNNWPATVGLVTGILAKEVVVATLNTLYTQEAHLVNHDSINASNPTLISGLVVAALSIPTNLASLKDSLMNPIIASAPEHTLNHPVYGIMYERFGGQSAAFAYLLFVLLYFPCISATAVMVKELNKKWTLFSVAWSTGLAYGVATAFYQFATINNHPRQSIIWITALMVIFGAIFSIMKRYAHHQRGKIPAYVVN